MASKPGIPEVTGLSVLGGESILVTWALNTRNEQRAELERWGPDGAWQLVAQVPAGSPAQYQDRGLRASSLYYYRVRAVNALGASAYSAYASARTAAAPAPSVGWVLNFADAMQSGAWALVG